MAEACISTEWCRGSVVIDFVLGLLNKLPHLHRFTAKSHKITHPMRESIVGHHNLLSVINVFIGLSPQNDTVAYYQPFLAVFGVNIRERCRR